MIYYSFPPYNSSNINDYGDIKNTVVLNFGKKGLLPYAVSTLYSESDYSNSGNWKVYKNEEI